MRRSTGSGSSAVLGAGRGLQVEAGLQGLAAPASVWGQDRLSKVVFGGDLLLNASQHQAIAASCRKRPQMRAVFFDFWRDRLSLQFAQRFALLIPACLFERVAAPSWKRAYVLAVFFNIEFRRKRTPVRLCRFMLGRWRSSFWCLCIARLRLRFGIDSHARRGAFRHQIFRRGLLFDRAMFWIGKLGDVFDQLLACLLYTSRCV